MASLLPGTEYGLSTSCNFVENKELVFVKLTESSLKAIEEYLKNKNKSTQTPTIQFLGNDGHLSIPTCRGDDASFKFSLSSNQDIEGPQGSFECVQQTGNRSLTSLGAVQCKMRIMAKDDVYAATKHRMAAAEQQHKRNCAREVELDKSGVARNKNRRSKVNASVPPKNGLYPNCTPPSHTKPQGNNHAQKPGNPDIMRRPIRDRLVHLLAVRPYKKPELYTVLSREGIRDKDKTQIMGILCNITLMRDNTYHLMRHVWNDVREDWPFFTEQDRQMLKRRKPQNLTPPGSSDGGSSAGSGQSPSSTHPGSPHSTIEAPPVHKRPGYYNGADGVPTKRQRIAHCRKPEEVFRRNESPALVDPPPSRYPTTTMGYSLLRIDDRQDKPPPPQPTSTRSADKDDPVSVPAPTPSPTIPAPILKFQIDYPPITCVEERRRYKADFSKIYEEYWVIHNIVAKVADRFEQLEEQLLREEKDSEAWKRVKNQILKEYDENKKDKRHNDARRRFQYLHDKLSHIKRLVYEYDMEHPT